MMAGTLTRIIYICLLLGFSSVANFRGRAADFDADAPETASSMRTWHVADGLPSDSVTAIIQTHDSFLWVGTSAGLVRFDGVKFTAVKPPDSPAGNLTGITALCEDGEGHLWVGTQQNGLFELAQGRLLHYGVTEGLLNDNVTSLAADNRGQVWIGGNAGLSLWTGKRFQVFTKNDGLPDESVSGVNVARSGTVWITTRVGMCQFVNGHILTYAFQTDSQGRSPEYLGAYEDRRGNLWAFGDTYLINLTEGKRFNYFRSSETSVRIWSLCEGLAGRLWIGTSGRGLFCFQANRFQPVILGEDRWPYDVRSVFEDREGNLWLGTSGGGLVKFRLQSVHIVRGGQGLPNSPPTMLALDPDGRIYVGLQRGGLWAGEAGRFDHIGGNDGLGLQNFISSGCVAHDGTVWAGTVGDGLYGLRNGRGIHFTTADGLANNTVLAVCADAGDEVWASTSAGTLHRIGKNGMTRFDATTGLPAQPVTAMVASARGGLWLGTQNGQIIHEDEGKFTVISAAGNFGDQPVLALFEGEGRLWAGTAGDGLTCLANNTVINWNTNNGLPNAVVAGLVADGAKNLWLATANGIYRVDHGDLLKALANPKLPLVCKLISPAQTLPSDISGGNRALLSPDGFLWFATATGVLDMDANQTEVEPPPFPVYLESALVNGQSPVSLLDCGAWSQPVTNTQALKATVDHGSLEIHFTALSFIAPEEIRFRHKLEGFDADWIDNANARSVLYTRLTHGSYHFRVAARVGDGPWREAKDTFALIFPTPIYFQTWSICLYIVFSIAVVAGIVRVISHRRLRNSLARLEQQQSLERERMRIARDMHDEMGSKLTKISFLSEHVQMDAEHSGPFADKIQSIAQTSRELLKTMDEIVWVVNPRNDTLENLVAYLSHYAVEYFQNTSVECELRLPQEIPHYPLSSEVRHNLFLTFEEALNNVLKHSHATRVKVEMNVNGVEFELKVTDNGRGFPAAPPPPANGETRGRGGNGLKNMRQRLAAVGGECVVSSQPGAGTTVTARFRVSEKAAK